MTMYTLVILLAVLSALVGLVIGKKLAGKPIKIEFKISPFSIMACAFIMYIFMLATMVYEIDASKRIVEMCDETTSAYLKMLSLAVKNGVLITLALPIMSLMISGLIRIFDIDLSIGYKVVIMKIYCSASIIINCIGIMWLYRNGLMSESEDIEYVIARMIVWMLTVVGTWFGIGFGCEGRIDKAVKKVEKEIKKKQEPFKKEEKTCKYYWVWACAFMVDLLIAFVQVRDNARDIFILKCVYCVILVGMIFAFISVWWHSKKLYPSEKASNKELEKVIAKMAKGNASKSRYRTVTYSLIEENSEKILIVSMGKIIWAGHEDEFKDKIFELSCFDYEECKKYLDQVVDERHDLIQKGYRICKENAKIQIVKQSMYGEDMKISDMRKDVNTTKEKALAGKGIIMSTIAIYMIVIVCFPVILKYVMPTQMGSINNEWIGFLGSYSGGVLGGIGTLIAVYITVKNSLELQNESKRDSDERLQKEVERRNKEIADEKRETLIRERQRFANEIADQIGIYITHINNYYFASVRAERLKAQLTKAKAELEGAEKAVNEANEIMKLAASKASESIIVADTNKDKAIREEERKTRKYKEAYQEYHENAAYGKRTKANEIYFSLKTKLNDISQAKELVHILESVHSRSGCMQMEDKVGKWLEEENNHLMEEFSYFKRRYVYDDEQ